jgi:hypothetical protein
MSTEQFITLAVALVGLITAIVKHWESLKKGKGLEAVTDAIEQLNVDDIHRLVEPETAELVIQKLKDEIQARATANGGEKTLNKEVRKAEMRKIHDGMVP